MKKIFFDLETTGTDYHKHGIHQLSGFVEIDNEIVEEFDFKVAPNPKAKIEPEALEVAGVTEEQILAYPEMSTVYKQFLKILSQYVNRYDKKDKFYLVGFNNRSFDDQFLRAWFVQNNDPFFGSWFWSDSHDALVQASWYLQDRRSSMPNFQLRTVAAELGIPVDEENLHDALYDVTLTRQIYRVVTGIDVEL